MYCRFCLSNLLNPEKEGKRIDDVLREKFQEITNFKVIPFFYLGFPISDNKINSFQLSDSEDFSEITCLKCLENIETCLLIKSYLIENQQFLTNQLDPVEIKIENDDPIFEEKVDVKLLEYFEESDIPNIIEQPKIATKPTSVKEKPIRYRPLKRKYQKKPKVKNLPEVEPNR